MSEEFEELEQIPWSALAVTNPERRNRYVALGSVAVVALAAIGWMLLRAQPTAVAVSPPSPPVTEVPVLSQPVVPTTLQAPQQSVYSEADLMLINAEDEERLAVMHAESLVRDFITVDGDTVVAARLAELIPGIERDDAPTYAEWVRAYAVDSSEAGRYRVEVAYRLLAATDAGYVRQPARAVAVEVAVDVGGTTRLITAPEPVPLPELLGIEA